ncbi:hypothetical protein [Dasania marina]|uniref:hypothetical protein n=1 Tax=Dasania marina TaxID=471499 RepID=UPI0030DB3068|tara:strand:- start:9967 stop:10248 length:282 start_codon:yes stop_codon:yes gene_type:complete
MKYYTLICLLLLLPLTLQAQQPVVTLQSTVKGNQEQPKVLYIMPWQKADRVQLNYQPMQGITTEVFSNIDREEFLREMRFRQQLADKAAAKSP